MPKSARQKIIKKNDDLFRQIIRARDKVCQKTFRKENLQVAHFWSRTHLRVRWDLDNSCLLQGGIHLYWAHKEPQLFREFWLNRIGQQRFDELEIKARYAAPVKMEFLLAINEWLQLKLEELN